MNCDVKKISAVVPTGPSSSDGEAMSFSSCIVTFIRDEVSRQLQVAEVRHAEVISRLQNELNELKRRLEGHHYKQLSPPQEPDDAVSEQSKTLNFVGSYSNSVKFIEDKPFDESADNVDVDESFFEDLIPGNVDDNEDTPVKMMRSSLNGLRLESPANFSRWLLDQALETVDALKIVTANVLK